MPIVNLSSKEKAEEIIQKSGLLALHFCADWVEQCSVIDNAMNEMMTIRKYESCTFARIPAEDVPEISLQWKVIAVPTVVVIRDGKEVDRVEGANPSDLRDKLNNIVSNSYAPSMKGSKMNDEQRLKALITMAPVVLFMKGTPSEPKCGFSRQIVQILQSESASFKTFDILSDSYVREGLKKFSNWPTYPQLYINGELIGGLDIVKELVTSGEFASMVPKQEKLEDRLTSLINSSPVMLFLKGDKETPRCGFSRKIVEILNENNVEFSTFDILQDETVRQGLKEYSNWPTYPQVYIKGQLIGGLDIVKELVESGEFKELVP